MRNYLALGVTGWMDRTDARIPVWKFVSGRVVAEEWSRDRLAEPGNLLCIENATANMLLAECCAICSVATRRL